MKISTTLFALVSILTSTQALATYTCTGPVNGIAINPKTGQVLAESIAGIAWPALCSTKSEQNNISVETCQQIFSLLLTAQLSKKEVTLWFNDGANCQSHQPWVNLTGWYFGPRLQN